MAPRKAQSTSVLRTVHSLAFFIRYTADCGSRIEALKATCQNVGKIEDIWAQLNDFVLIFRAWCNEQRLKDISQLGSAISLEIEKDVVRLAANIEKAIKKIDLHVLELEDHLLRKSKPP